MMMKAAIGILVLISTVAAAPVTEVKDTSLADLVNLIEEITQVPLTQDRELQEDLLGFILTAFKDFTTLFTTPIADRDIQEDLIGFILTAIKDFTTLFTTPIADRDIQEDLIGFILTAIKDFTTLFTTPIADRDVQESWTDIATLSVNNILPVVQSIVDTIVNGRGKRQFFLEDDSSGFYNTNGQTFFTTAVLTGGRREVNVKYNDYRKTYWNVKGPASYSSTLFGKGKRELQDDFFPNLLVLIKDFAALFNPSIASRDVIYILNDKSVKFVEAKGHTEFNSAVISTGEREVQDGLADDLIRLIQGLIPYVAPVVATLIGKRDAKVQENIFDYIIHLLNPIFPNVGNLIVSILHEGKREAQDDGVVEQILKVANFILPLINGFITTFLQPTQRSEVVDNFLRDIAATGN